ncbi:MAG: aspartyl/asparaginyl beta-hydroxylase domain-containing protein [Flavobacteriales bacterium]|nr:aspartyl/asparaginyl beta-hydroxylase domain-containing protein [Flavobacteriales bacterium]
MNNRPWYFFYSNHESLYRNDTYYNSSSFSFTNVLEENYSVIHQEIKELLLLNESLLGTYFNDSLLNAPNKWRALSFYFWGVPMSKKAIDSCPKTITILSAIPNIISASVSVLEPHAEINPHYGDTDAIYRCHFALEIPSRLPNCGFRVGYEDRPWENGKLMVFNDAAYHKAWNKTDKRRIILLVDVLRPEFEKNKKWICAMVRGCITWQIIVKYLPFFSAKKSVGTRVMSVIFASIFYLRFSFLNRKSAWL